MFQTPLSRSADSTFDPSGEKLWTQCSPAVCVSSRTSPPVDGTTATCEILHLDLGPLSLNLLGLQVNLSEVVLDISAQQGSGNLLGNLLCAVANLLNGGGLLSGILGQVSNLLNQILGILGGLGL